MSILDRLVLSPSSPILDRLNLSPSSPRKLQVESIKWRSATEMTKTFGQECNGKTSVNTTCTDWSDTSNTLLSAASSYVTARSTNSSYSTASSGYNTSQNYSPANIQRNKLMLTQPQQKNKPTSLERPLKLVPRGILGLTEKQKVPLALNYDYHNRTGCRIADVSQESSFGWSSFSSSGEVDPDHSDKLAMFEVIVREQKPLDFVKYIPLPSSGVLYVPKCSFHKRYPLEWKEAQKAYELQTAHQNKAGARGSKSDTAILENEEDNLKRSEKRQVRKKIVKYVSKVLRRASKQSKSREWSQHYPSQTETRFSQAVNENYVQVNLKEQPDFRAKLLVSFQDDETLNHDLLHVKTELLASAMLNFFYPYSDVQVLWKTNLQDIIVELTVGQAVSSMFHRTIHCRGRGNYTTCLVLSPDASQLLRHKNTAFIHGLAAACEVPASRVLVLVDDANTVLNRL